jgi:citrate lyase subunit beta / citryl-CoA lyase
VITVGHAGEKVRADVQILVEAATEFSCTWVSSTSPLYDHAIESQIEEVATEFGRPSCRLACVDSGALPFTWKARLRTALRLFTGQAPPRPRITHSPRSSGLCRSRLYIPGNTPKLYLNAPLSRPDAIILDLEESVGSDRKEEALDLVIEGLRALSWGGTEMMARVNAGERGLEEIRALAAEPVDTFILPKVETADQVKEVDRLLESLGADQRLFPLIESALGVENAFLIAGCSPRVRALSLGLEDYLADIGAKRTQDQSESAYARSRVLNAARATGALPLASVYPGFEDRPALEAYVRAARDIGCEGIGCIHPAQVPIVHEAFRPSEEEQAKATAVLEAYESASQAGSGVTSTGGQMIDLPTYRRALRVIERAAAP